MNGVIIFADNRIFEEGKENGLFKRFLENRNLSVLPIDSLQCLESFIKSASIFKACIVDWDFENGAGVHTDEDFENVSLPSRTPMNILMDNPLYSLVYIYSEKEIPEDEKSRLEERYKDKIKFRAKSEDIEKEYVSIINDIQSFEKKNPHMIVPFLWSQAINQSAQKIFSELESASSYWIKEIRDTANSDGGDATSEVIDIFNNLLNEELIQNMTLRSVLDSYEGCDAENNDEGIAKLYWRIYYSRIYKGSPIMTGDIFKFDDDKFGILISPECELVEREKKPSKDSYDFLLVSNSNSESYKNKMAKNQKEGMKLFNNDVISRHVLISFPFEDDSYNRIGVIYFNNALVTKPKVDIDKNNIIQYRTDYKLNAPYIYQLRQRFVAYFGKFGVPAIPESLRKFNLK